MLYRLQSELTVLEEKGNLRHLPEFRYEGRHVIDGERRLLNLSTNDYLGLAMDSGLRQEFLHSIRQDDFLFSASSSRLLTGNHAEYERLETHLADLYGTESALVFNSGYHMNAGILPAVCDSRTLVLADKLVHASLIDGIRLSKAKLLRYRHNDNDHAEALTAAYHALYDTVIVATESVFSMDGDVADLRGLIGIKKRYRNVYLYVDEAHAVGVRGENGLGCAEEQGCIGDIDFLVGTFGKALASVGGFLVCRSVIRDCLVNRMRPLVFTTGLPPVNVRWTRFVLERLAGFGDSRAHLDHIARRLRQRMAAKGYACPSASHIVPLVIGDSAETVRRAEEFRNKGFHLMPVRPPSVPDGGARIRISLNAAVTDEDVEKLAECL